MYSTIYNPVDNKFYSTNSKLGKSILGEYINHLVGGATNCDGLKKYKPPKCTDQVNCEWVKGKGCYITNESEPSTKPKKMPKPIKPKKTPKKTPKNPPKPVKQVNATPTFSSPPPTKKLTPISPMKTTTCLSGTTGKVVYDVKKNGVLLAKIYDGRPVDNWWASEKWDGYRAIWNGKSFKSRSGKDFDVPEWYKSVMPPGVALDGELWLGRGGFQDCGLFRKKKPTTAVKLAEWETDWVKANVKFKVFDILNMDDIFENRMIQLNRVVDERNACMVDLGVMVPEPLIEFTTQTLVSKPEALKFASKVISQGGEGIMLRKPESLYESKRSSTLYKIKEQDDMEGIIIGYHPGNPGSKYDGLLGSFICHLVGDESKVFKASGMDDSIRNSYKTTHPVGTMITITYNGLSKVGIPRHPRYLRIRHLEAVET